MVEIRWFLTALLLMFIGLKISGVIHWSWWWVLAPFWAPLLLALFGIGLQYIGYMMMTPEQREARKLIRALRDLSDKLS